ncbi:MAG TPA: hypothetical protein VJR27_03000 [Candidatus Saccharimonadales bacterium]|nr:hypothetical protein [Candidatus Saccharimonadales bacterium]
MGWPLTANATQSTNYQIQEDFIGGVGGTYANSTNYQSIGSAGAAAVGDSSSANYRTQSGATTTNDPSLSFAVNTSSVALGTLSTGSAGTGTAAFSVLNYTSYGYVVQVLGNPPSYGGHSLTAMSGAASSAGTEQFGINLVANTTPASLSGVSANPQQVPSGSFSNGTFGSGYGTTNTYKYNSGDTIAQATQSSGQTTYTISYVANISGTTPAGAYTGAETLICTGTY